MMTSIPSVKVIRGTLVHPVTETKSLDGSTVYKLEILEDRLIKLDHQGVIISIEPGLSASAIDNEGLIDLPKGSFLLPTFVDCHLHAPQYLYTGTALELPLIEWLDRHAFQAEKEIDEVSNGRARIVYGRLAKRLLEVGTGCLAAFGTVGLEANMILVEELNAVGLRGFVGKVNMDRNSPDHYRDRNTAQSLTDTQVFIESTLKIQNEGFGFISPIITPRFVPTCSSELLAGLGALAEQHRLSIQTHAHESTEEVTLTCDLSDGRDDLEVLETARLLGHRTILAHCTHLLPLTRLHGHHVSVAHCPLSNIYFSTRAFPLREAMDSGLKVGLGSDIAGGYRLDLLDAMRAAVMVSRGRDNVRRESRIESEGIDETSSSPVLISWQESIYLATQGGANALGLGDVIGSFEPGKHFDAQLILPGRVNDRTSSRSLSGVEFFGSEPDWQTRLEKWWHCGDERDRMAVWIKGSLRFADPDLQTLIER